MHFAFATLASAEPSLTLEQCDQFRGLLGRSVAEPVDASIQGAQLAPASAAYLDYLLQGDRKGAVALTRRCATDGMDISAILIDILEPAMREVGRRWALGRISIAQEHFCTAVTEFAMTDLYPGMFSGMDSQRRLLALHAPGSLHHVGLRMVTDILECRGWSTTYIGENIPPDTLPALIAEDRADLVLISASMPSQISHVRAMIQAIREDPFTRGVKVVVGGRPFLVAPDLVDAVGADGWARDARGAVQACDDLIGGTVGERR